MTHIPSARLHFYSLSLLRYNWLSLFAYLLIFLLLSSCASRDKPAQVVGLSSTIPLKDRVKQTINSSKYTVKKGETLYSIAWRANSDVRQLATLNKIKSPYQIFPGQKLFLVAKKPQKPIKVIKNKSIPKKGTQKITGIAKSNAKKTLASTKKQAYGKKVTTKKIVRKVISQSTFSKKMSGWQWPVKGKITEYFSNKIQGNKGINIGGRRNTQIKAAAKGMVVYAGDALRGYGKLIIIKHNEDYLSAYAHNEKILVKENQRIKLGDVIAKMGSTGASSVMLHFEVRFRGKSVDPLKYLPKR